MGAFILTRAEQKPSVKRKPNDKVRAGTKAGARSGAARRANTERAAMLEANTARENLHVANTRSSTLARFQRVEPGLKPMCANRIAKGRFRDGLGGRIDARPAR